MPDVTTWNMDAPVRAVELCSIPILLAFVFSYPPEQRRSVLLSALLIGVAAVMGEESVIALYHHYEYSPLWSLKVLAVPVMVGCIWPAVVLSAREVIRALTGGTHPVAVAALVLFDATLVEAVSVRAGLWRWEEGAVFGVPLIGLWGWTVFAGAASAVIDRGVRPLGRLLMPLAFAHAAILAAWWMLLRWVLRAPLPRELLWALSVVVALAFAWRMRAKFFTVPLRTMGPRAAAAVLFFVLASTAGVGATELLVFTVPFAVPYVLLTRWVDRPPPRAAPAPPAGSA